MPLLVIAPIIAVVTYVALLRRKDRGARAHWLQREGEVLIGLYAFFVFLFVAGEAFTDPGGWFAAGLVAVPLALFAGLVGLVWKRPDAAVRVLAVLTGLVFVEYAWLLVGPEPSEAIVGWFVPFPFVVLSAAGALGWKKPKAAGTMLMALTLALLVFFSLIAEASLGALIAGLALVAALPLTAGVLYLVAARMSEGDLHPGDEPGNETHRQAA